MANKDPIVRLDGARPANTYIPSCLLEKNTSTAMQLTNPQKYTFKL